jgi:hypothetical protein
MRPIGSASTPVNGGGDSAVVVTTRRQWRDPLSRMPWNGLIVERPVPASHPL